MRRGPKDPQRSWKGGEGKDEMLCQRRGDRIVLKTVPVS